MKSILKRFLLLLLLYAILPVHANTEMTEISCDTIRRLSFDNRMTETYTNWGFYIYDAGQKLYYAPSGKSIEHTSKIFNENQISYFGVPLINDMVGEIHINRQSGSLNMQFKSKYEPAVVTFNGRCSKIGQNNQF